MTKQDALTLRSTPRKSRATFNWLVLPAVRVAIFQSIGAVDGEAMVAGLTDALTTHPGAVAYGILWDLRRHDWRLRAEDLRKCHEVYVRRKPKLAPLRFAAVSIDPAFPFMLRLAQDILRLDVRGIFPAPEAAFASLTDGGAPPDDAARFLGG